MPTATFICFQRYANANLCERSRLSSSRMYEEEEDRGYLYNVGWILIHFSLSKETITKTRKKEPKLNNNNILFLFILRPFL